MRFSLLIGALLFATISGRGVSDDAHTSPSPDTHPEPVLVPAASCTTMAEFLKWNGRTPKTAAEWEHDLGKLGLLMKTQVFASTSPNATSLSHRRVVFVVNPTKAQGPVPLRHIFAVAGVIGENGVLDPLEFITPRVGEKIEEPEFGVIKDGVAYQADTKNCYSCHRNHGFLFPPNNWENTFHNHDAAIALVYRKAQQDPKRYSPLYAELVNLMKGTDSYQTYLALEAKLKTIEMDGISLQDDAGNIDPRIRNANDAIQMQAWVDAVPDPATREKMVRLLAQNEAVFHFGVRATPSVPALHRASYQPSLVALLQSQWKYGEPLAIHRSSSVFAPNFPAGISTVLKVDEALQKDHEGTLRRLLPQLPSSREGVVDPKGLTDMNGQPPNEQLAFIADSEYGALAKALNEALAKVTPDAKQQVPLAVAAMDAAMKTPELEEKFQRGSFPDGPTLLHGLAQGLKEYFHGTYRVDVPAFDKVAPEPPAPACHEPKLTAPRELASVTPPTGKCATCHHNPSFPDRLQFPFDPTDKKARDEWIKNNDPEVAKKYLQKYWVWAILQREMPPQDQGGPLSAADYQDLKRFLETKAKALHVTLPATAPRYSRPSAVPSTR